MRNPAMTREIILKTSGDLFNVRGYKATSISHITDATGFTKGAIYKHFANKDELERETFSYLANKVQRTLGERIRARRNAVEKLEVILTFFESYLSQPPIAGGCPLMNLAIESDDAHPALRIEARRMLESLRSALTGILENGVKYGQIKPETDCNGVATVILASLEGGIMMSKLVGSAEDLGQVLAHIREIVKGIET